VNLDGMNNVDNSVNGIRSTVSQEAVQEFQIITNGYNAEYGQASGGVVNIITKSGTNDTHGSAYAYLRNRNIQATNPFSTVKNPAYTRIQPGATLGGPIVKDRTFYFFSFETTRRHETGFSSIGQNNFGLVPVDVSRFFGAPQGALIFQGTSAQQAFLTGIPNAALANPQVLGLAQQYAAVMGGGSSTAVNARLPVAPPIYGPLSGAPAFITSDAPLPGSFHSLNSQIGNFPVFEGTSVYSLRLDHRLTNNQQLMLRGNVSPSTVTGVEVNGQNQTFGQNSYSRTSQQTYRDLAITAQHAWVISNNKVNELRYEYSRRGLLYNFSSGPGGGDVAINIPGFAFFGREPFSFVNRTEQRHEVSDNFTWSLGNHSVKFGGDVNHLPVTADFTVNFGGLYNFGALSATQLGFPGSVPGLGNVPGFSPVQAYGLGIPQTFVQGVGNPHDSFTNNTLGFFLQDSWRIRPNLTLNYGARYDVEFTPTPAASNAIAAAAQDALGITQGIPRDYNNIAPRIGIAWDPFKDGKTAVRASYGMFYDHPLLALAFDSDVADGSQAPQIILFGGSPCNPAAPLSPASVLNLNATNSFQGIQTAGNCLPPAVAAGVQYLPNQQRYNALNANSIFVNQQYLTAGLPLLLQPFSFPTGKNFQYAYSEQVNVGVERDLGHNFSASINYNYNGGHHINRPINVNPVFGEDLVTNFNRAVSYTTQLSQALTAAGQAAAAQQVAATIPTSPLSVQTCPQMLPAFPGLTAPNFVPAALPSFFRRAGTNPSLVPVFPQCGAALQAALSEFGLGVGVPVPFSDPTGNFSTGSSVYHGLTANLRKRFSDRFEFLASWTWSHSIDDSTDLQSLLAPQDNRNPNAEKSESTFDQRHRFVFSGVYQAGKLNWDNFLGKALSWFTVAPIIEASSGRPFNILVGDDRNFDFGPNTDRPLVVPANTPVNGCGDVPVASKYSPTGFLQPACFLNGTLVGNLKRNAGIKPTTIFTDLRVGRTFNLTERFKLDGTVDMFNLINKFNVADVNVLWTNAGQPTASFDPRQFQFGLKLSF
jgi:TonB-dependent receptor-like protein